MVGVNIAWPKAAVPALSALSKCTKINPCLLFGLHVDPEGVSVLAVHVNGAEHVELDAVLGCKLLDLRIFFKLLVELVTWES